MLPRQLKLSRCWKKGNTALPSLLQFCFSWRTTILITLAQLKFEILLHEGWTLNLLLNKVNIDINWQTSTEYSQHEYWYIRITNCVKGSVSENPINSGAFQSWLSNSPFVGRWGYITGQLLKLLGGEKKIPSEFHRLHDKKNKRVVNCLQCNHYNPKYQIVGLC